MSPRKVCRFAVEGIVEAPQIDFEFLRNLLLKRMAPPMLNIAFDPPKQKKKVEFFGDGRYGNPYIFWPGWVTSITTMVWSDLLGENLVPPR